MCADARAQLHIVECKDTTKRFDHIALKRSSFGSFPLARRFRIEHRQRICACASTRLGELTSDLFKQLHNRLVAMRLMNSIN